MESADIRNRIEQIVEAGNARVSVARDPVNRPMIHHLCDALGDSNPVYTDPQAAISAGHSDVVAPPAALQVWNMLNPGDTSEESDIDRAYNVLSSGGYPNVVAVNCEQLYTRYLQPGDLLKCAETVEDISGPKRTGLGVGYFITTVTRYYDQSDEEIGQMRFRTLWYTTDDHGEGDA